MDRHSRGGEKRGGGKRRKSSAPDPNEILDSPIEPGVTIGNLKNVAAWFGGWLNFLMRDMTDEARNIVANAFLGAFTRRPYGPHGLNPSSARGSADAGEW